MKNNMKIIIKFNKKYILPLVALILFAISGCGYFYKQAFWSLVTQKDVGGRYRKIFRDQIEFPKDKPPVEVSYIQRKLYEMLVSGEIASLNEFFEICDTILLVKRKNEIYFKKNTFFIENKDVLMSKIKHTENKLRLIQMFYFVDNDSYFLGFCGKNSKCNTKFSKVKSKLDYGQFYINKDDIFVKLRKGSIETKLRN